jgi:uncharacterized membrane protein
MKTVILLCIFIAGAFANFCFIDSLPPYRQVLTFINDQVSDAPVIQFQTYEAAITQIGLTPAQIEAQRQTALAWLKSRYGLPTETAIFDPTSNMTILPDIGYMLPITVANGYDLASSLHRVGDLKAKLFEFVLFPFPSAIGTVQYHGSYGAYMASRGLPTTMNGDTIAVGTYHLFLGSCATRVGYVSFGNKYPVGSNAQGFTYEEMSIVDSTWGTGLATVSARTGVTATGKFFTQFVNTMIFSPVADSDNIVAPMG